MKPFEAKTLTPWVICRSDFQLLDWVGRILRGMEDIMRQRNDKHVLMLVKIRR
jgi:hypothetical protein